MRGVFSTNGHDRVVGSANEPPRNRIWRQGDDRLVCGPLAPTSPVVRKTAEQAFRQSMRILAAALRTLQPGKRFHRAKILPRVFQFSLLPPRPVLRERVGVRVFRLFATEPKDQGFCLRYLQFT